MPDRPLTIVTYAAGASLAAATLVYVFGPTFFFDNDAAQSSKSSRKKGIVGLTNPANDCFINSVLQSLAGLPELRLYLIQEMHRRRLDGPELYHDIAAALAVQLKKPESARIPEWKISGLQQGLVTAGLKDILNALNERPLYKKTISAQPFIQVVEESFRTRISRSQQDAHEFLQIIAERLAEEYHAGQRARRSAQEKETEQESLAENSAQEQNDDESISAFPLEGKLESQVECLHCHFKPKPSTSSFVVLTLHVPQDSSTTTLNACLDGMLKVEHIDDFTCDRCRLTHAVETVDKKLTKQSLTPEERAEAESHRAKFEEAIATDPEKPPKGVPLPDSAKAPKRRIARHMRIASLPRILAVHLSRSVWNGHFSSSKNMAKVTFPETLSLGGLLDRRGYHLCGVVTHKGGHNSGHYESFRRQTLNAPFSTPNSMGTEGIYSVKSSPAASTKPSVVSSPQLDAMQADTRKDSTDVASTTTIDSRSIEPTTSIPSIQTALEQTNSSDNSSTPRPSLNVADVEMPRSGNFFVNMKGVSKRRDRTQDRWWRISDDKVKESKTTEVLSMQKEVYLLFYERDRSAL